MVRRVSALVALLGCMILLASTDAWSSAEPQRTFAVAAYLPEWRYEGANWKTIFEVVTHLILFSLEVTPTGDLAALDRIPRPELMQQAQAARDASGQKMLMCVGGNGRSNGFAPTVASARARANFIRQLVKLCKDYRLDGVDYNWEYPGFQFGRGYDEAETKRDYQGLFKLLKETKTAFQKEGLIATMAYYPDKRQESLLMQGGAPKEVELLHMMAYDQSPGRHSTMEFAQKVVEQGIGILPPASMTLGLPFYSRSLHTGDWTTYEDLVQKHLPGPDVDEPVAGEFMNGITTIKRKTELAHRKGLGGVMIWEVGQDCRVEPVTHGTKTHVRTCPNGKDSSLLFAIKGAVDEASAKKTEL